MYHIFQKNISQNVNPFVSLAVTYLTSFLLTIILYFVVPIKGKELSFTGELRLINKNTVFLGFALVLLELGFLLAYRMKWNISVASLTSTVAVTLVLIPVGILFFHDSVTLKTLIGVVLCIAGIIFLQG